MAQGNVTLHPEILDRFDIIGVDIRGTGLSSPVNCDVDLLHKNLSVSSCPTDQQSFDAVTKLNTDFHESCLNRTGPLLDYMDTTSIARDHESARLALGGEPMTYLGTSYGTQLGTQYAELFPNKIRAMVLDGVVSLSPSEMSNYVIAASAAEVSLKYFFD
jgi:pimeloyl-ACP methyl ester carboxylesterase